MPRIQAGGAPGREHYDRNPIYSNILFFTQSVAPHAQTVRSTFTVPTGKRAIVESARLDIHRETAAGPAGIVFTDISHAGPPSTFSIIITALYVAENTIGDRVVINTAGRWSGNPGDVWRINTADAGTGGTIDYNVGGFIVEFDE